MKASQIDRHLAIIFSSVILLFLIFSFASCSKKIVFPTSSVAPAAKGSAKIKKDKNNNYSISVNIENLPDSKRLNPPRSYYIVWIETRNNGIKNIGRIISSSGFLTSKMKASLKAVSPVKPHRVFITAENEEYIRYPRNMIVLDTGNFK